MPPQLPPFMPQPLPVGAADTADIDLQRCAIECHGAAGLSSGLARGRRCADRGAGSPGGRSHHRDGGLGDPGRRVEHVGAGHAVGTHWARGRQQAGVPARGRGGWDQPGAGVGDGVGGGVGAVTATGVIAMPVALVVGIGVPGVLVATAIGVTVLLIWLVT